MSAKRAFSGLAFVGVMLVSSDATSQSPSELLTDPTPFEIGYVMSFYDFDACGDSGTGRLFRRGILEMLEACPFSPDAMGKFKAWRIETLEDMAAQLSQMHATGQEPPGPVELYDWQTDPPRQIMSCSEYRQTPHYLERRGLLLRYGRGEITVDQAIGADCPSGPASL